MLKGRGDWRILTVSASVKWTEFIISFNIFSLKLFIVNRYQDLSPFMTLSSISEFFVSVFTLIIVECPSSAPSYQIFSFGAVVVAEHTSPPSQTNLFESLNQKATIGFWLFDMTQFKDIIGAYCE